MVPWGSFRGVLRSKIHPGHKTRKKQGWVKTNGRESHQSKDQLKTDKKKNRKYNENKPNLNYIII